MEIIIGALILIIIFLITYLFLLQKELKRVEKEAKDIVKTDSNQLLHLHFFHPSVKKIVSQMNDLLLESKQIKIEYEQKNKRLKKMMMNLSHDLRTPLTSALGYLDLVQSSTTSNKELKMIEERLKKLEHFMQSFFDFSIVLSKNQVELYEVNIISVLEEAIAYSYEEYHASNREIIFSNILTSYYFLSNRDLLIRIFDNIIGNAYKHGYGNLKIIVKKEDTLKICFENNFISNDFDVECMFDEFYTVDISRSKGNTGLGLAIAKEFTQQLNGIIYAKKDNKKLKMIVEFPGNLELDPKNIRTKLL